MCGNLWSINEAIIVCNQLGYYGNVPSDVINKETNFGPPYSHIGPSYAYQHAYFGRGSGQILYSSFICSGVESALIQCLYNTDTSSCSHLDDVGVSCSSGLSG